MLLSADHLRESLDYDPETGAFAWRRRANMDARWNNRFAGTMAGTINAAGYVTITIDRVRYTGHRLAWLYVHGAWPPHQIDHINGDRADNRIANLRPATNTENARNATIGKNNTSGFKGVSFHKKAGKWSASICVDRRTRHLGLFETPEAAHEAYVAAAELAFGQFARVS